MTSASGCKTCGKPIKEKDSGDLAAYLLQANYCCCQSGPNLRHNILALGRKLSGGRSKGNTCPRCGLEKVESRDGSMTSYLFQDLRCKCEADPAFARGAMTSKFFNLKKAGMGTTFGSTRRALDRSEETYEDERLPNLTIDLVPGAIIGGVYEIIDLIGCGAMGEVYLANHRGLQKQYALKVIPPDQVTEVGWLRFQLEAKSVAALNHVNLVKVTDLGIHEGCLPFYAMEYVEGDSLADIVHANGPMPLTAALEIFKQICDGVDHAHRAGIIHRDLKPANIMVAKSGAHWQVKVLDFGLAKLAKQDREKQGLTSVGEVFGTPYYMSPEQCLGDRLDNRSDIYSLGCTMFECLTGQPPFAGKKSQQVMLDHESRDAPALSSVKGTQPFPESIEIVMAKLLRKNPVERYQTCLEFKADLERVERHESVLPVYMSRARATLGDNSTLTRASIVNLADLKQGADKSADHKKRTGTSLVVAAVSIALFLAAAYGVSKIRAGQAIHQAKPASAGSKLRTADQAALPEEETFLSDNAVSLSKHKSAVDTEPYSEYVTVNGVEMIEFEFAKDTTIGVLRSVGNIRREHEVKGEVRFRKTDLLEYQPWVNVLESKNYCQRFRPGDFQFLCLNNLLDPNLVIEDFSDTAWLKTITGLTLIAAQTRSGEKAEPIRKVLTPASVKLLFPCNKITSLAAMPEVITANDLASLPWLKNLHALELLGYDNADEVLLALRGSKNLDQLVVLSKISESSWKEIYSLKNLTVLYNQQGLQNKGQLRKLAAMPTLHEINLGNLVIDDETVSILRTFKDLRVVTVVRRGARDEGMVEKLKTVRPGFTVRLK